MKSLLLKIFVCPITLIIAMYFFAGINYLSIWQPIVIGLVLAFVGVGMEYFILRNGTLWISVGADFVTSVLIVYFLSNLLWNASVTFLGAIFVGIILGVIEYFTHRFLISSGKAQNSPV
ncbi:DUF2512 family protein [Bacillus sp. ISL-34]|uniref:DUF2512 family protein n=1 Tax=Bacillus sp. ISL-34 TaxID=2819121 RepID=UPI001BE93DE0|nr:DUF2512 family protein [Bacillus sp. ISL-34]MBT2650084.1 DUF2512 family protein [Bacillus sp. ISL-34]